MKFRLLSLYIPALIMSFGQGMVGTTIPILAHSFNGSVGLAAQAVTAQLQGRAISGQTAAGTGRTGRFHHRRWYRYRSRSHSD
ncbi:MAG: hypothetical protein EXR51_08850 [Dehalococcoidia bacterium]|nr:hypothetical protein [Dehalococcoidia bacterium]